MAKCAYCGTTIIFGKKSGELRYCNDKCRQRGILVSAAAEVPPEIAQKYVESIHAGKCPKCGGEGPVDVHTSHRVWSAFILTSWQSIPEICCRKCGNRNRALGTGYSLLLGWWGFPHGIIMTPIMVTRNIVGMFRGPDPTKPSKELVIMAKYQLGARVLQARQPVNAKP